MRKLLFFSFFSFVFLSLAYLLFLQVQVHTDIDSKAYIENGLLFYKNLGFAARPDFPYYTLGYPMFIGLAYKLFGVHTNVVIFLQVLLTLLACFLLFFIARRLFNKHIAYFTFVLASFNLGFLTFCQFVLTETLLMFLLVLFTERFSKFLKSKCLSALVLSGLSLGLSIIVKPAAIYFIFLLVPLIFACVQKNITRKLSAIALFVFSFYVPITGYMLHNKIVFNKFTISKLDNVNILFWFYPNVLAEQNKTTSDLERVKLHMIAREPYGMQSVRDMFYSDAKKCPGLFLYVWLKNVFKTYAGLFTTNLKLLVDKNIHGGDISFFKTQGSVCQKIHTYITGGTKLCWVYIVGYLEFFLSFVRYFIVLLALFYLLLRKKYAYVYFFSSYLFYFSMITGHDGCARFRMLFEFMLVILMAVGLYVLFDMFKCKLSKSKV